MENSKEESTVNMEDIPTPTKDEPVIPNSTAAASVLPNSSTTPILRTNSSVKPIIKANSSAGPSMLPKSLVTPTVIGKCLSPEAPASPDNSRDSVTPTLDENPDTDCPTPTMDEPVQNQTSDGLSVNEVKCKLFSNETDKQSNNEKVSEKPDKSLEGEVAEKMVPNGSVSDQSKPNLNKSVSNDERVCEDLKNKIVVKCDGELFTCCECNHMGKGHHFEEHLMCHLIHRPYQCLYCKEAFATRKEIGKHLSTFHKGMKLNCMLKALNRAKALMIKAKKNDSCEFFALVTGKELKLKRNMSNESSGSNNSLSRNSSESSETLKSVELSKQNSQHDDSRNIAGKEMDSEGTNVSKTDKDAEKKLEESEKEKAPENNSTKKPDKTSLNDQNDSIIESDDKKVTGSDGKEQLCNSDQGKTKEDVSANDRENKAEANAKTDTDNEATDESKKNSETKSDSKTLTITEESPSTKPEMETRSEDCPQKDEKSSEALENHSHEPKKPDEDDEIATKTDLQKEEVKRTLTVSETCEEKSETTPVCDSRNIDDQTSHGAVVQNCEKEDTDKDSANVSDKVDDSSDKDCNQTESLQCSESKVDTEVPSTDDLGSQKDTANDKGGDESMGLKIVAAFSLDGDDYSQSTDQRDDNENVNPEQDVTIEESMSVDRKDDSTVAVKDLKSDSEKALGDTSNVVIDVFKDGRIAVINNTTTATEKDSLPKEKSQSFQELSSKLHQSKLSQLLTAPTISTGTIPSGSSSVESMSAGEAAMASSASTTNSLIPATVASSATLPRSITSSTSSTAAASSATPSASTTTAQSSTSSIKPPGLPSGITAAQMKHARNPNFYVCGLTCNFSCLNSVDFRDHLFLAHAGEKSFPCYYCGFLAHTEESLLRHITNHSHSSSKSATLYLCGTHRCRFGSNMLSDLLNHMQILHSDVNMYVCKECNETFSGVKELVSHFEDNFIHVVNCPHCACKGTDRRMILKHIAEYHPGKAKMVSVAKQIICRDRKEHHYKQVHAMYKSGNSSLLARAKAAESQVSTEKREVSISYTGLKNNSQSQAVPVKEEKTTNDSTASQEKQIQAQKCQHCTFVARDQTRLESHIKCHGLPVAKRHRFRCMYCPQGFDVAQKFRLHVNCHPGLIKYWMYYCKRCDFDTNQRFVMLRHIRTRDELHFNVGNEEDMFSVVERIIESRVLECEHCNYQTRHRLHLQIHFQREHKGLKSASSSPNVKSKPKPFQEQVHSSSDSLQENASKKFKCPFCRYLVPKAADLKSHVKKHANLGKITIDFLRCRYCSLSSTARGIVYDHIREKHPGKSLVLVRKMVTIDCSGTDNTFSETSVTEDPLTVTPSSTCTLGRQGVDKYQCETCSFATVDKREFDSHVQLHNTTKGGIHSMAMGDESDSDEDEDCEGMAGVDHPQPDANEDDSKTRPMDMIEQVYVIPEAVAGDQLSSPARCCSCYYASGYRSAFIEHMTSNHPEVMLVVRNKGTTVEQICPSGRMFFGLPATLNNEVLLVPDRQVFTQAVKCPKCPNFATYFRRNLVLHLSKDHSEITAMGKCTWPGWQASSGGGPVSQQPEDSKKNIISKKESKLGPQDESCIIGSGDLDEQIGCLYKNYGDRQQCLICNSQKPKKFFMHIHILRHLNLYLMGCPYCPHKGLQKYKVGRHIRIVHPEKENIVKELKVDIPRKVAEFLAQQKKAVSAAVSSPLPKTSTSTLLSPSSISPISDKDSFTSNKLSGPLGTPDLDDKLFCLYTSVGGKNKCNLCSVEFARKYAIHRHIVVNHLKVSLLKCGHCDFQGVEKHVIIDHILEQHKNQHIRFEPLNINMAEKVREFLNTYNIVKAEPEPEEKFAPSYESPSKLSGPQSYCLGKDKLHNKLSCLFMKKGESFKCRLCNWKFPRKYAIHRHLLMKHMKIGLYGCTHCHVQGAERYIVISHMKEAHPKVPPQARMLEIDMDQRIREVLQEAALGKGNHFAGRRPKSYSTESESMNIPSTPEQPNVDVKKEDQNQMVVAMFGKKRKSSPEPIPKEEDSAVTPKKLKTTSRMVDVTSKIKVVCVQDGNFKKFVCEKCRFTSLHRSNVYRHVLRIHEKYRELQCARCGYKTFSKVLLEQHIEVEHEGVEKTSLADSGSGSPNIKKEPKFEEEDSYEEPNTSTSDEPVKHYACAYCNFETNTAENIIKHTRENHAPGAEGSSPEMDAPSKSEAEVTVSILGNVVKKSSVKRGTFTESQMLYCGYCTFKAPGVQTLKDHHKENHQPNKLCIISPHQWRYICRVCGLKNNAGSKMRCHLNRHLEYRPFTCSSCSQGYASTDELRKHIRNLHHSEQIQYLKHEKKEQKINRFLEESRKNALLVNIGAPPGEESMGPSKPLVNQIESPKTEIPPPEPKFKGIKRTMKMPMSPAKSLKLKKKYWMAGIDRESKAMTRDIACNWCDIPHTFSVDQMKQHHTKAHPDKEFLWVDTRSGNTCTATGEVRVAGTLIDIPKMDELHTRKQLANKKMKYYCTRCSFSAWYLPAMVSHCRCHLPKKHLCAYCHLRYSNKEYLHKHQDTFHPGRESWVLSIDGGQAGGSATVSSSVTMETPESEQAPALVEERRVSQSIIYCCNFCPFKNESLYQYRLHLTVHGTFKYLVTDLSNDSPLKCGFCPFIAQDQVEFSLHISTHFENRTYKCGYCSYSAYTRAHVRFHCQNQHSNLDLKVLDLSSAASYVEDLKAEKTNLPNLVDLDPRVMLKDIQFMSQRDLENSMSEVVEQRIHASDEDEFVDVEKVDDATNSLKAQSKDASKTSNESASEEPQTVHSSLEPAVTSEGKKVTKASANPDRNESPGVVSSSVGTDGEGFDMAEVSAFVDESINNSKLDKSENSHSSVESDGNKSLNISGIKSLDDSETNRKSGRDVDEVDGGPQGPAGKEASPVKDTAERSSEIEDIVKKDDSGNVFDTLQSWLKMK